MSGPRVVALGGGHGLAASLGALRLVTDQITAVVTVADRCGGIPVGELDHLFEPGWRGDSARTSSDRGLGLGLAIAEAVAEIHGGSVTATNARDGSGCVFSLALPAMLPG